MHIFCICTHWYDSSRYGSSQYSNICIGCHGNTRTVGGIICAGRYGDVGADTGYCSSRY